MKTVKLILNALAFLLTIIMLLYGLWSGLDAFELITNFLYFTIMVIVTFIDLVEELQRNNSK